MPDQRAGEDCPAHILVSGYDWTCERKKGHDGRHKCQVGSLEDVSWEVIADA